MIQKDFAGLNNFVWFTGVVADSQDKAQVGRIRVRIIGWHNENKNLQPDNELPWAQILLPVNNSRTLSLPKPGEWVFGFFQDGNQGQMPVVMGVYPRIQTKQVKSADSSSANLKALEEQLATAKKELALLKTGYQGTTKARLIAEKEKQITALEKSISSLKSKLNKKVKLSEKFHESQHLQVKDLCTCNDGECQLQRNPLLQVYSSYSNKKKYTAYE